MKAVENDPHRSAASEDLYIVLAAVFIAALVACNLVFQKFFIWELPFFGSGFSFQQSVGVLAYPVTFLVTDVLSEIYGKERADRVVTSGLVASLFVMGLVVLSSRVSAAPWSPVDDATFQKVFGLQWLGVTASMLAYLGAQYLDIRLFHYWKRRTRGKHLWLRNNASTITSQVVDTALVNGLLAAVGTTGVTWERFPELFWNGVLFKWSMALLDTPLFYAAVFYCRRRLRAAGEVGVQSPP
ncbi:MAG TPA: queuosine precursor transporter [Vicinamibacteria bacterium]|nr:queuosine precursor transporter [Vicinamibacteria bacterium]